MLHLYKCTLQNNIMDNEKSIKKDRFIKVASRRVQKTLEVLDSLSNCSNKQNYSYDMDDIKKMFSSIRKKLNEVESEFIIKENKKNKTFKF